MEKLWKSQAGRGSGRELILRRETQVCLILRRKQTRSPAELLIGSIGLRAFPDLAPDGLG
jgi:hypothetical protein